MKKHHFTLQELLLSAAVTGVLAALCIPALHGAGARNKSEQVICMNNLKQINTASSLYSNDHNGFFVRRSGDGVMRYSDNNGTVKTRSDRWFRWMHYLNAYVPMVDVKRPAAMTELLHCPNDRYFNYDYRVLRHMVNGANNPSYGYNYRLADRKVKVNQVKNPSAKLSFTDNNHKGLPNGSHDASCMLVIPGKDIAKRHDNSAALSFVDGHVELANAEKLAQIVAGRNAYLEPLQ